MSVIKEADSNIDYIKSDSLFSVLRKEEFLAIIEDYTSTKINMPNGLVYEYCKEIFMQMPLNIANKYFISAMKKRCNDKVFGLYLFSSSMFTCFRLCNTIIKKAKRIHHEFDGCKN